MNTLPVRSTPLLLLTLCLVPAPATAQTVAASPVAKSSAKAAEELIALNPFEVKAEADKSYGALNSNSLTQFNTALNKTPVSADIFTEEFMRDISATSIEDMMLNYGAGTGMVSAQAPDSDALSAQPGDRVANSTVGVRGVNSGAIHRDGFTSTGNTALGVTSTFSVERAEVVRGPQPTAADAALLRYRVERPRCIRAGAWLL